MATLKEEEPFAFVVANECLPNTCSFCLAHNASRALPALQGKESVHLCKGCHVVAYCNEKCQKSDWINHKNECQILKKLKSERQPVPGAHMRLTMRILLKSELELAKTAFNGRTWNSLDDHLAKVKGETATIFYQNVDSIMAKIKHLESVTRVEVAKSFSKVIANTVEIIDTSFGKKIVGIGLYLGLSIHKHSCIPDSQLIFTGTKAALRAFDETAKYSTNLTISYYNLAPFDVNRNKYLKKIHFIDCTCPMCADENYIMNRMGSSCYVKCCEDAAGILDENCSGPYRCNKCGKASTISFKEVKVAEKLFNSHMMSLPLEGADFAFIASGWINKAMDILVTNEKILSVYNLALVNMCKALWDIAGLTGLHGIRKYALEKEMKAAEYYLHEIDARRVIPLKERTRIKYTLNSSDFDEHKALKAVIRAFGKDHPVAVDFKKHVEGYGLFSEFDRAQIAEDIRNPFSLEQLVKALPMEFLN